jgi:hypothetical protein
MEERHITRLHASAPDLETPDIDMHRPPTDTQNWGLPLLSSLASHPSLRHLTLRFPSPILDPDECYSWTTWAHVEDIYGPQGRPHGVEDGLVNSASMEEAVSVFAGTKSRGGIFLVKPTANVGIRNFRGICGCV